MPHPELAEQPEGTATIETYTVMHDREGKPDYGIVIGRLEGGRRCIANVAGGIDVLEDITKREMVGELGRVRHDGSSGKNLFEL